MIVRADDVAAAIDRRDCEEGGRSGLREATGSQGVFPIDSLSPDMPPDQGESQSGRQNGTSTDHPENPRKPGPQSAAGDSLPDRPPTPDTVTGGR
jgi:hypothetical protein